MHKTEFGTSVERLAEAWYLSNFSCSLVARNFRIKSGEIDLIFEQHMSSERVELVFVEVRARLAASWESGIESVGPKKIHKLHRTISFFLQKYRGPAKTLRLDVMAWDGEKWERVENAW